MLVAVLVGVPLARVSASTVYTWNYPIFNSETANFKALDDATTSIAFRIVNCLVINATTEGGSGTVSVANASTGTVYRFDIVFLTYEQGFEVILNMPDYVKILHDTWVENQTTYVKLESDGDLFVWTDDKTYIDDYNLGTFTMRYVSACGLTDSFEAGYLSVRMGSSFGGGSMMDSIGGWLPIIVQFAMLGLVMGLIKKFGRG